MTPTHEQREHNKQEMGFSRETLYFFLMFFPFVCSLFACLHSESVLFLLIYFSFLFRYLLLSVCFTFITTPLSLFRHQQQHCHCPHTSAGISFCILLSTSPPNSNQSPQTETARTSATTRDGRSRNSNKRLPPLLL